MVVTRITADLPAGRAALERVPATSLSFVDERPLEGDLAFRFWAEGPSLREFDAALEADGTVAAYRGHGPADADRRLYHLRFAEETTVGGYCAIVDNEGVVVEATGTAGGWDARLFFPDREQLAAFYDRCRTIGLELSVRSMTDAVPPGEREDYGLTPEQRDALRWAADAGYFDVPRDTSLVELAGRHGLSDQALSERLRRGMGRLVDATVDGGEPGGGGGPSDGGDRAGGGRSDGGGHSDVG